MSATLRPSLSPHRPGIRARGLLARWHLTVPGLLTAVLGFRAGGFFAGTVGLAALTAALALVLRFTLTVKPLEGWRPALVLASGALAGLAIWQLASVAWSHAPARALSEFNRTLLYGLVLVLTGSAARRARDLAVVLRWTAAAFTAFAIAGLLTRLLPASFPSAGGFLPERLSF